MPTLGREMLKLRTLRFLTRSLALGAICVTASSARAAEGFNLSWQDCAEHGALNRTFACNTNSGRDSAIASFVLSRDVWQTIAIEAEAELQAESTSFPKWWELRGTTQCRNNALALTGNFASDTSSCEDPWGTAPSGGIGSYVIGIGGPNRARFNMVLAVPLVAKPLVAGVEYSAIRFILFHSKTVGTPNCPGCSVPVCLTLNWMKIVQPTGAPDGSPVLSTPLNRAYIKWQSASDATCATPARRSTWGALKALYR